MPPYRNREITFALSESTRIEFDKALKEVNASRKHKNGNVKDVKVTFDRDNNPLGVITVREQL